jgi:protein-S-isoprenylcysteine O-methyltransferase Ste14
MRATRLRQCCIVAAILGKAGRLAYSPFLSAAKSRVDLDVVEKTLLLALVVLLALRMVPAVFERGEIISMILLAGEAVVVGFVVLRRRARQLSRSRRDWAIGFAGMLAPLLVMPGSGQPVIPSAWCGLLMVAGFALQMAAKFALARSFGVVPANRGVKAGGPYRLIRHPMYLGYFLTHLGFFIAGPTLWNLTVYAATYALQVARVVAEERLLMADPAYRTYAATTRYRLIPLLF